MAGPIKNIDFQNPSVFAILTFWNFIFVGQGTENGQNRFLERLLTVQKRWQDLRNLQNMFKNDQKRWQDLRNLRNPGSERLVLSSQETKGDQNRPQTAKFGTCSFRASVRQSLSLFACLWLIVSVCLCRPVSLLVCLCLTHLQLVLWRGRHHNTNSIITSKPPTELVSLLVAC